MKTILTLKQSNRGCNSIRLALGLATGLVGLIEMLSILVPKLDWNLLLGTWSLDVHHGVHALTVVVGFFLLMLSYGLARGKSQARHITITLLLLSALLNVLRGSYILITIVLLLLAILLLLLPRFFQARSNPPSVRRGYLVLLLGLGMVTIYTIGGFIALYDQFAPQVNRLGTSEVLLRLIAHVHLQLPHGSQALLFAHVLSVLFFSTLLYGMLSILRPVAATLLSNEKERYVASTLTRLHGTNSISYFALSPEKSYFFSTSGKSIISYVVQENVAVVAGDPIGPEEELPATIQQFIEYCQQQDWATVFWQVRADLAALYRFHGLHLLKIGEDAVINAETFTLKGGAMANVRASAKRAEKEGLHVVFYRGQISDIEQLNQVEHISQTWLVSKGGSEMGFSMGHFDPQGDEEQIYALAVDATNKVHAFVTFIPIYGRYGWGLDLMRRAEACAPGTMELLLSRSIEHLKSCGAKMVSLGLAPMSNANHDEDTLLHTSIDFLTRRFGSLQTGQSLFNFKKKFQPTWESRYLVYPHPLKLPRIGLALYRAHQQDPLLMPTLQAGVQRAAALSRELAGVPQHLLSSLVRLRRRAGVQRATALCQGLGGTSQPLPKITHF